VVAARELNEFDGAAAGSGVRPGVFDAAELELGGTSRLCISGAASYRLESRWVGLNADLLGGAG
jgi:hypothetical protein